MLRIVASTACIVALFSALIPGPNTSASAAVADSPHAYFEALQERPEHWKSYSLRDPKQLARRSDGGYAQCNVCPLFVTYDPPNDFDPRRQDAAKVLIPANRNDLPNAVFLPLRTAEGNSYFFTWDVWFGAEYEPSNTTIATHKTFQFSSNESLWFEIQSRWSLGGTDALGQATGRGYPSGGQKRDEAFGPNVTNLDPLPYINAFKIKAETWTRYWVVIDQRIGDYDLTSLWAADENRNPIQIMDRIQLNAANSRIDDFWLEYDTSTETRPLDRGPLVAYIRNFAVLRNVTDPTSIMQRPNAGTPLPPPPPPSQRPMAPRNLRIIPPPPK